MIEELKPSARKAGLWNLFLPCSSYIPEGPSNLEYMPLCETMGRVPRALGVSNRSAPDTGNMEMLGRYTSEELEDCWFKLLLRDEIRSASLMAEPAMASPDATSIEYRIECQGDEHVINGHK